MVFAVALAAGAEAPRAPDAGEIEGEWLQAEFAQALASGAIARQGARPLGPVHALMLGREAGSYRLRATNFHELLDLHLIGIASGDGASWRLLVEDGQRAHYDATLSRDAAGRVTQLRGALWSADETHVYQRVEPDIARYVNRHLIAGRYLDAGGRRAAMTEFRDDGTATWEAREWRYRISLDPSEAGCRYLVMQSWPYESQDDQRFVGFAWHDSELQLFEITVDAEAEGSPIQCAEAPMARLHAVRAATGNAPLLQPLALFATRHEGRAVYQAQLGDATLRLPRHAAPGAAMDFTEHDAHLLRPGSGSCAIAQDHWFGRREFWYRADGSLLAFALRSASGGELRVLRVRDCSLRASLPIAADVSMQTGRVVLAPACEKTSRHVWLCQPGQVWRLSSSGELRRDQAASQAYSEAVLGFSIEGPAWFARSDGKVLPVHESRARRLNEDAARPK